MSHIQEGMSRNCKFRVLKTKHNRNKRQDIVSGNLVWKSTRLYNCFSTGIYPKTEFTMHLYQPFFSDWTYFIFQKIFYQFDTHFKMILYVFLKFTERSNILKGTGEMKLAGDFQLPFSYFLSDHHDFSHIRVAMCYSWSFIEEKI